MNKFILVAALALSSMTNASTEIKSIEDLEQLSIHEYKCYAKIVVSEKEYSLGFKVLARNLSDAYLEFSREYGLKELKGEKQQLVLQNSERFPNEYKILGYSALPIKSFKCEE